MRCPTCNSTVAEDAAVCPKCDAVLDPSLLDAKPPRPIKRAPRGSGVKKPAPRPAQAGGKSREPRRASVRSPQAPPARSAPKRDWRDEISEEDWNQMPQGAQAKFVPDKALDPDDVMGQAKVFILDLSTADKLAFFGAATMLLACFFPWKETVSDGEVLGLLSLGVVVFALSLLALGAIVVRVRSSVKSLNPLVPWIAQLLAIGFSELWCVMYAATSLDTTAARSPVGNFEMWVSKPSFGLILAFLAGIVAAAGTVMGLKVSR